LTVTSGAGPEESVAPAGYSLPTSHSTVVTSDALSAAAAMPFAPLKVVFIGDSITQGAGLSRTDWTPCDACAHALELGPEPRQIFYSNEGHSGHTTKDYLPGGSDFSQAIASATRLNAEHDGLLVFSIMLGTNDSASRGPNGSPIDSTTLHSNLRSIVARLLQEFPQSEVVLNRPTWYSSNTHNGATYEEEGLQRLTTYFPVLPWLAREFPRGRVFEGDTRGYDYFAATYLTTLRPEHGQNGTFYLHPNPAGARDLGCLWAQAILRATK
jgi:lysophospholipase L1-like esterase